MNELEFCIHLSEDKKRCILEKHHFTGNTDFDEIENLCGEIEQKIQIYATYRKICSSEEKEKFNIKMDEEVIAGAITLGAEFDNIECGYSNRGEILKTYMMDCIGMEILLEVYDQMIHKVYEQEGLWISKFDFIGNHYPISLLKDVMDYLSPNHIKYNNSIMLIPKKSVVFIGTLSEKKTEIGCGICKDCGNLSCDGKKE